MFLTRLRLDPTAYRPAALLRSTQRLHAAVAASFPEGDGGRVLWRLEPGIRDGEVEMLVASPTGPDEREPEERITAPARCQTRDYRPLLDRLSGGDRYRFRATLNPILTRSGRHTPIFDEAAQIEWLARKLAGHGADITGHDPDLDEPAAVARIRHTLRDAFAHNGSEVRLLKVCFEGTVRIDDPAAFGAALRYGIGRAKGYGCGLLTLAPA